MDSLIAVGQCPGNYGFSGYASNKNQSINNVAMIRGLCIFYIIIINPIAWCNIFVYQTSVDQFISFNQYINGMQKHWEI